MVNPNYKNAREEASKLLSAYKILTPPVDPEFIAEQEGIDVVYVDFNNELSPLISGLYDFESNKIYINKGIASNRKTFTIAHELAHAILHKDYAASNDYRAMPRSNRHIGDKPIFEKEADVFAASLLVPTTFLKKYIDYANNFELAQMFAVSEDVISIQKMYMKQ